MHARLPTDLFFSALTFLPWQEETTRAPKSSLSIRRRAVWLSSHQVVIMIIPYKPVSLRSCQLDIHGPPLWRNWSGKRHRFSCLLKSCMVIGRYSWWTGTDCTTSSASHRDRVEFAKKRGTVHKGFQTRQAFRTQEEHDSTAYMFFHECFHLFSGLISPGTTLEPGMANIVVVHQRWRSNLATDQWAQSIA